MTTMVAVGYGPEALVDLVAARCGTRARSRHRAAGIPPGRGRRYWSYVCVTRNAARPRACPSIRDPFRQALAGAAIPVLPDRAAVAARVAPLGGIAAESMRQATRRAERHVTQLLAKARKSGRLGAARHLIASEGLAAVGAMITTYRARRPGTPPTTSSPG
jgi:hypothetical protein